VDAANAYVRQTVRTDAGQFTYDLYYNRFYGSSAAQAGEPPGRRVGVQQLRIAGKMLLCDIYEQVRDGHVYRTLRCEDIFGSVVQHSDNAEGVWKIRQELTAFRE
jgi:hypothetical protein